MDKKSLFFELSPRAWGLLNESARCLWSAGAIPTCVGLTQDPRLIEQVKRSYPHWCEEYAYAVVDHDVEQELPPRAWGLPRGQLSQAHFCGAIPTDVGRTVSVSSGLSRHRSYPHVRGAYVRVRYASYRISRAIPTCVGLTSPSSAWPSRLWSYPH